MGYPTRRQVLKTVGCAGTGGFLFTDTTEIGTAQSESTLVSDGFEDGSVDGWNVVGEDHGSLTAEQDDRMNGSWVASLEADGSGGDNQLQAYRDFSGTLSTGMTLQGWISFTHKDSHLPIIIYKDSSDDPVNAFALRFDPPISAVWLQVTRGDDRNRERFANVGDTNTVYKVNFSLNSDGIGCELFDNANDEIASTNVPHPTGFTYEAIDRVVISSKDSTPVDVRFDDIAYPTADEQPAAEGTSVGSTQTSIQSTQTAISPTQTSTPSIQSPGEGSAASREEANTLTRTPGPTPVENQDEEGGLLPILGLGGILTLGVTGWWWNHRDSHTDTSSAAPTDPDIESQTRSGTDPQLEETAENPVESSPTRDSTGEHSMATSKPTQNQTKSQSESKPSRVRISDVAVPDEIPTVPDLDIPYEEITKEQKLGGGGNADVHKSTFVTEGQEYTIALKIPRFQGTLHVETIERFRTEAKTWQQLDESDYIVGAIDWETDPLPWLALEYMDGGTLKERVGTMDIGQAVWTTLCVTRGVLHAHEHGIVHHDLKPSNLLFRKTDTYQFDVPKIADWGLAKLLLEHSKSVEGLSPQYSAPEQFSADEYGKPDKQTDIYQLGAVFYELFTGEPVFSGDGSSVMYDVLETDPTPPTSIDPTLPDEIEHILLKCLAKEKRDRYESVLYLRDDLKDLIAK